MAGSAWSHFVRASALAGDGGLDHVLPTSYSFAEGDRGLHFRHSRRSFDTPNTLSRFETAVEEAIAGRSFTAFERRQKIKQALKIGREHAFNRAMLAGIVNPSAATLSARLFSVAQKVFSGAK
jgi:hypothetical protein